jgi:3-dehydroquinate synthase
MEQILTVIETLGLPITHPLLEVSGADSPLLKGLEEFREHLGGKLTITLLNGIGRGEEVHEMDGTLIQKASEWLRQRK